MNKVIENPREIIKELRLSLKLTQPEAAEYLGIHPMTISKYERGSPEPPKIAILALDRLRLVRELEKLNRR